MKKSDIEKVRKMNNDQLRTFLKGKHGHTKLDAVAQRCYRRNYEDLCWIKKDYVIDILHTLE